MKHNYESENHEIMLVKMIPSITKRINILSKMLH
jgi:hypothetical protein